MLIYCCQQQCIYLLCSTHQPTGWTRLEVEMKVSCAWFLSTTVNTLLTKKITDDLLPVSLISTSDEPSGADAVAGAVDPNVAQNDSALPAKRHLVRVASELQRSWLSQVHIYTHTISLKAFCVYASCEQDKSQSTSFLKCRRGLVHGAWNNPHQQLLTLPECPFRAGHQEDICEFSMYFFETVNKASIFDWLGHIIDALCRSSPWIRPRR